MLSCKQAICYVTGKAALSPFMLHELNSKTCAGTSASDAGRCATVQQGARTDATVVSASALHAARLVLTCHCLTHVARAVTCVCEQERQLDNEHMWHLCPPELCLSPTHRDLRLHRRPQLHRRR